MYKDINISLICNRDALVQGCRNELYLGGGLLQFHVHLICSIIAGLMYDQANIDLHATIKQAMNTML